jgi:hypothetical protein
MMKVL